MTPPPIILEAQTFNGRVSLRILGHSPTALAAIFTLEVVAGSNRSTHQGNALLEGGVETVLSTISASAGSDSGWSAVLRVQPDGGNPYEQRASSPG